MSWGTRGNDVDSTHAQQHQGSSRPGIRLFGTTQVLRTDGDTERAAPGGVKPRQVLEILAVSAGTPVPKDRLAEMLWDGRPPRSYAGTLESYVCLVRRALGVSGRGSGIATVMHGYVLDPDQLWVDLVEFRALAGRGREAVGADDAARLAQIERAVGLVTGDLLGSEPYASWALHERDGFGHELAAVAAEGAECALRLGQHTTAVRLARVAIERDAFAEGAWRALIGALDAGGRRPEALRAYAELRDLLSEELGTTPSESTTRCYLAVLTGSSTPAGQGASTTGEELALLLQLLREGIRSLPGVDRRAADRGLVQLASVLPIAG